MKQNSRYYGPAWSMSEYPAAMKIGSICFWLFINYFTLSSTTAVAMQSFK
jgi:hypothetical protein